MLIFQFLFGFHWWWSKYFCTPHRNARAAKNYSSIFVWLQGFSCPSSDSWYIGALAKIYLLYAFASHAYLDNNGNCSILASGIILISTTMQTYIRVNFLLSYLIISGSINLDHNLPNFKVIWIFAPKQFFISWWSWYNFSKGFCTAGCPPDAPRRYCNVTAAAARKKSYHLVWYIMDWLIISHCCSKTTPRLRQILRQMCGLWKE